ncbi:MAG TPA: DUF5666 domain-containing protein [Terriglobales bacterium]|nr:DUF5666 domain-containing protein [Terriglobales bacterium]
MKRFYPFLLAVALMSVPAGLRAQQPDSSKPKNDQTTQQTAQKPERGDIAPDTRVEEMPVTVKTNEKAANKPVDTDPVMGVPPLPEGKTSMIGGNVASIDAVHNKMKVKIFGDGGKWDVAFDERTHFYRDGKETTFVHIKKGDRVYVDTMSDKRGIFARNVRVVNNSTPADARGQVESVNNGVIRLRDDLSARPVQFTLASDTQVKGNGRSASMSEVQPGALIAVKFSPEKANRGVAREITVLAAPGQSVTFAGKVTHLDLRSGQFAVANKTDNRTYDIAFDRERNLPSDLMVGSEVTVAAQFDGRGYKANRIDVDHAAQ